jgi:CheY-like chemotaxis protein/signal transduction histidine kinase
MFIIDELIKILKRFGTAKDSKEAKEQMLLNSSLLLAVTVSAAFLIYFTATGQFGTVIPSVLFIIGLSVLLFAYNKNQGSKSLIIHGILSITLLYAFYLGVTGGNSDHAILWVLLYPAFSLLIFSASRVAVKYTAGLFLLFVLFFLISPQGDFFTKYSINTVSRFLVIYFTIMLLEILYFKISEIEANRKEKELLDYKKDIQEKNQMISDLSFKLRSPLNHLVGILNLKEDTQTDELIEEIELSVDNLVSLVNTIPSLSGVKGLKVKKRQSLFSLQKSIRKTVALFQTEDYQNLRLHLNISGQLPSKIYADITVLKQIIISVIDFFYNYSEKEKTELELIIGKKSVSDRGCEILFKLQSNKPLNIIEAKKSGNFINNIYDMDLPELTYIDRQIKKMNGKLNLYSDNSGTAFLFSIEAETEDTETTNKTTIAPPPQKHSQSQKKEEYIPLENANILLVEDDKVNQKIMVLTLKKYVKSIEVAQNGKEAIEKIGQKKYDLILMDIRMPFMNGYKTTRKIRETEAGTNLHVPIIAVTANALEGDKEKCLEAGMDDYMSKPLKTDDLLRKMKTLLNE